VVIKTKEQAYEYGDDEKGKQSDDLEGRQQIGYVN